VNLAPFTERDRTAGTALRPIAAPSTSPRPDLRGQAATLERLRVDRQLQEALAHGPDPLHLAAMFGLDPKTAIRYAENARQLLITAAGNTTLPLQANQGSSPPIEREEP
jgi:hypothetical protein